MLPLMFMQIQRVIKQVGRLSTKHSRPDDTICCSTIPAYFLIQHHQFMDCKIYSLSVIGLQTKKTAVTSRFDLRQLHCFHKERKGATSFRQPRADFKLQIENPKDTF